MNDDLSITMKVGNFREKAIAEYLTSYFQCQPDFGMWKNKPELPTTIF